MSKRSPRLLFTDEELAAPELKKACLLYTSRCV